MISNFKKLEELGRLRFPSGAEFDKSVRQRSDFSLERMIRNLPDNYPDIDTSRIASVYRAFCEERERALKSLGDIADDEYHNDTRPEYLFQILGDLLFIDAKSGGVQYTDASYRDFLIKVRNAYLRGSTAQSISTSLSDILGIPVHIRQMYLDARKTNSAVTIKDTHRMVAEIFLTDASTRDLQHLAVVIQDLYFFMALIKPAGSLFNTNLMWEESLSVLGCGVSGFGSNPNGNTPKYVYSDLPNKVYSLLRLAQVPGDSPIVGEEWVEGTVSSIDEDSGVITLTDGSELVISDVTSFYKYFVDEDGVYRVESDEIPVGANIWFLGDQAPGSFNFYSTPDLVQENWYAQFDPEVIASPEFQSRVIVSKDSTGNTVVDKNCSGALVDTHKDYVLQTSYEDLRSNCDFPSPKIYKSTFTVPSVSLAGSGEGYQDIPAVADVSSTPNEYTVERVPLSGKKGGLATADDITLYIDSQRMEDGILSVTPWEGVIVLNFNPPAGSEVRFDYYRQDVYPTLVEESFSIPAIPETSDNDVGASAVVTTSSNPSVRFQWPFGPEKYKPSVEAANIPLDTSDLDFSRDLTQVDDAVFATPETNYEYLGNSMSFQMNDYPMLTFDGKLCTSSDVAVTVDGEEVVGGVSFIRPLLGHVQLNFMPPAGSTVAFNYHHQPKARDYIFMPDSSQHLADRVYGVESSYNLLPDPNPFVGEEVSLSEYKEPALYGYRYSSFDLGLSSVWNSEDTFKLNDVDAPPGGSYMGNQRSSFNRFRVQHSAEFLYDTHKFVELNDQYIFNDLEPLLKLGKGIPPFYRSFTSWAEYRYSTPVVESDSTFQDGTANTFDVQASANVETTPSGLVEYVSLPDYNREGRLKQYSGTEESLTVEGDEFIELSSICEERSFALSMRIDEEYYPNRELRLNDYKDYVERLFFGYAEGVLTATAGSDIYSTKEDNWSDLVPGDLVVIEFEGSPLECFVTEAVSATEVKLNVVFSGTSGEYRYVRPSSVTGTFQAKRRSNLIKSIDQNWLRLRKGALLNVITDNGSYEFTVSEILSSDTIRLDRKFPLTSGKYRYQVSLSYMDQVDVMLNNVTRRVELDLKHTMPWYDNFDPDGDYAPWKLVAAFQDPDNDAYPRNNSGFFEQGTPPLLNSGIDDQGSEDLHQLSVSQARKMVKFRNWDQELVVVNMGLLQEPLTDSLDDNADSIRVIYWNVADLTFVEYAFRGMLLITSESLGTVAAVDHPEALIRVENTSVTEGLNDTHYELRITVIHQLLPDHTMDIMTIEEFVRLP